MPLRPGFMWSSFFFFIWSLTAAGVSHHDLRGLGHLANLAHWRLLENPTSQPFKAWIMRCLAGLLQNTFAMRFLTSHYAQDKVRWWRFWSQRKDYHWRTQRSGQTTSQIHHSEDSGLSKAVKYRPTINGESHEATSPLWSVIVSAPKHTSSFSPTHHITHSQGPAVKTCGSRVPVITTSATVISPLASPVSAPITPTQNQSGPKQLASLSTK